MLLLPRFVCTAQTRLYLDAQLGAEYAYVDGAHLGKGKWPLKAHRFDWGELAAPMVRLQYSKWSFTTGYSGGNFGWGYQLRMPSNLTHNPWGGYQRGHAASAYAHRIPLLISRRLTDVEWHLLTTDRGSLKLAFRLEGIIGGGVQAKSYTCLDCGRFGLGSDGYDTIRFEERPYWRRRWGGYLTAGATARFFRHGKERLTLRLLVTQGLQDMIVVPLNYSYNGRRGSTTLHVRGSGVSLAVGYPFRLHTFRGGRTK